MDMVHDGTAFPRSAALEGSAGFDFQFVQALFYSLPNKKHTHHTHELFIIKFAITKMLLHQQTDSLPTPGCSHCSTDHFPFFNQ